MDDVGGEDQKQRLARRFENDGIDTRLLTEPFLEASEFGDAIIARQRLGGLDPDERRSLLKSVDQQGRTGLLLAASKGDADLVDVLLDASANPNDSDNFGTTALHYAVSRGSTRIVESLLHACANALRRDDREETPLFWAKGEAVVRALLLARAEIGARSVDGKTALICAADRGDSAAVRALACEPGADIDALDNKQLSAVAVAQASGHSEVCEFLLSIGAAPVTATSNDASTVVHVSEVLLQAARDGDVGRCTELLESGGTHVNDEVCGETALLAAVAAGSFGVVECILEARADANRADTFLGETPLLRAVLASNGSQGLEILWLLLEARAAPSKRDKAGRAPAEIARSWGHSDAEAILRAALSAELPLDFID